MDYYRTGYAMGIILFALAIFVIPWIFFLLTQQNTLKAIQPQNRTMNPGEVWLTLIPFFGLIWIFIVVNRIADSLNRELNSSTFSFEQNNNNYQQSQSKPTYSIGLAYCVLFACSIIPVLGSLAGLGGLICWIIYWVKLSELKSKVEANRYNTMNTPSEKREEEAMRY